METPQLKSLYQQLILEHYRRPRNKGELADATVEVHMLNPSCGDEVRLQLTLDGDRVEAVAFTGHGCSISQASISMMTQRLDGSSVDDALALASRFTRLMHGDSEVARDRSLGDLRALAGVSKFPVRVKCALLGFDALREALAQAGVAAATARPSAERAPDEGAEDS
jgi:nitrogen fixation NifU-like protein